MHLVEEYSMNTTSIPPGIAPEVLADGDEIINAIMDGRKPDAEVARRVHEPAEKIRSQIFEKHGLLDIGVPAIRELRDS